MKIRIASNTPEIKKNESGFLWLIVAYFVVLLTIIYIGSVYIGSSYYQKLLLSHHPWLTAAIFIVVAMVFALLVLFLMAFLLYHLEQLQLVPFKFLSALKWMLKKNDREYVEQIIDDLGRDEKAMRLEGRSKLFIVICLSWRALRCVAPIVWNTLRTATGELALFAKDIRQILGKGE